MSRSLAFFDLCEETKGMNPLLHIYLYKNPGVEHHSKTATIKRKLTFSDYEKYKSFFEEVKSQPYENNHFLTEIVIFECFGNGSCSHL